MEIEDVEKGGVHEKGIPFIKPFVLIDKQVLVRAEGGYDAGELLYFGKVAFQGGGDGSVEWRTTLARGGGRFGPA